MQETKYSESTSIKNDRINLREVLKVYIYHWKFFLFSIVIALIAAFLYLQFATYEYEVSSTILINDESNGGGSTSQISVFEDLGLFAGPKTSLDTEMGVLKSKTLIEGVIKELGLNISYYTKGGLSTKEVYGNEIPFNLKFFAKDSVLYRMDTLFSLEAKSNTQYMLFDTDGNQISKALFGERISTQFGDLMATPKNINNIELEKKIIIKISPLEHVAINLKKGIKITQDNLKSNLLVLSMQDPVKLKAQDILDNLVAYYNKDANEYKSQIGKNTDEFIINRIKDISVELTSLDRGVETYKTRNKLSNIDSEAGLVLASNADIADQIVKLTSQIKLVDYVTNYMKTNKDDLIPSNLGMFDNSTSQNTVNYNNLLLERNRLLRSANKQNPIVANLNSQIANLRESIDRSLINMKSSMEISLNEAKLQETRLGSKLSASPKKEREIRDIQRQQQIIETLYLYLLQKREENSISLAVIAPNAKVIDSAFGSNVPVSPRKLIVLLASLLLGMLLPAFIILLRSLFDNKIHTQEDIEDIINAPIIGDIPNRKNKRKVIDFEQEKSNVAESFRLLRTNINYTLSNINKESKTIFVTSTIRNEGKTFVAINLAKSLALLNKKILLIEADFRSPKLASYLNKKQEKGLTHFLTDPNSQVTEIISSHDVTNLDIIVAGMIPPTPSELLSNGRFDEVLEYAKQNYDYVIVDTSAVNVATDTLLISQNADLFIYVIRANYLSKKMLSIPKTMCENKRLPNMAILINDTEYEKRGYDNVYSFGQDGVKKSWWNRIFN